jgi:hypothetical protein
MSTRIAVLGAGFGGMELSAILSESLGDKVQATLIDKSDTFIFGFSKLDVMFAHTPLDAVRLPYCNFVKPGVRMLPPSSRAFAVRAKAACMPVRGPATSSSAQAESDASTSISSRDPNPPVLTMNRVWRYARTRSGSRRVEGRGGLDSDMEPFRSSMPRADIRKLPVLAGYGPIVAGPRSPTRTVELP